jgi:hypothetical protein
MEMKYSERIYWGLFNNAVSTLESITLNGEVINE